MISDKDFIDSIHMEIHAVRRIQDYKASIMEKNISKLVLEYFKDCKECQDIKLKISQQPKKEGFFKKIGRLADDA